MDVRPYYVQVVHLLRLHERESLIQADRTTTKWPLPASSHGLSVLLAGLRSDGAIIQRNSQSSLYHRFVQVSL